MWLVIESIWLFLLVFDRHRDHSLTRVSSLLVKVLLFSNAKVKAFCLLSFSNGGSIKRDDKEILGRGGDVCVSSLDKNGLPLSS